MVDRNSVNYALKILTLFFGVWMGGSAIAWYGSLPHYDLGQVYWWPWNDLAGIVGMAIVSILLHRHLTKVNPSLEKAKSSLNNLYSESEKAKETVIKCREDLEELVAIIDSMQDNLRPLYEVAGAIRKVMLDAKGI